jgi:hypothetical protein
MSFFTISNIFLSPQMLSELIRMMKFNLRINPMISHFLNPNLSLNVVLLPPKETTYIILDQSMSLMEH